MRLNVTECTSRLITARHGILGTTPADRGPDLVPVCFVATATHAAVPIDTVKPKASTDLRRRRNLVEDPRATLLVEHWDEDWSSLWWVRAGLELVADTPSGRRADWDEALRAKYPPYAGATFADVLVFAITGVTGWSGAG